MLSVQSKPVPSPSTPKAKDSGSEIKPDTNCSRHYKARNYCDQRFRRLLLMLLSNDALPSLPPPPYKPRSTLIRVPSTHQAFETNVPSSRQKQNVRFLPKNSWSAEQCTDRLAALPISREGACTDPERVAFPPPSNRKRKLGEGGTLVSRSIGGDGTEKEKVAFDWISFWNGRSVVAKRKCEWSIVSDQGVTGAAKPLLISIPPPSSLHG